MSPFHPGSPLSRGLPHRLTAVWPPPPEIRMHRRRLGRAPRRAGRDSTHSRRPVHVWSRHVAKNDPGPSVPLGLGPASAPFVLGAINSILRRAPTSARAVLPPGEID